MIGGEWVWGSGGLFYGIMITAFLKRGSNGAWACGWAVGGVWGGAWHGGECLPASLSSGGGAAVGGPLVGAVGAMGPFWLEIGPFRVVGGLWDVSKVESSARAPSEVYAAGKLQ